MPQYILDSFIDRSAGAYCNIVVTQVLQIVTHSVTVVVVSYISALCCHVTYQRMPVYLFFKPPPPVGAGGGYMFSGRPSVRASVVHVVVLCFRDISSIC